MNKFLSSRLFINKATQPLNKRFLCVAKSYGPIAVPGKTVQESAKEYAETYKASVEDPTAFWAKEATKYITWSKPFTKVITGEFAQGTAKWFEDGQLNVSYNAIDRHIEAGRGNDVALIWEGDEMGDNKQITFNELKEEVSKIANVMKSNGIKKGDVVTLYMPMIPQIAMVMLACTRIGAVHSIVFAGFSSESLKDRIKDCKSKFVFTADEGKRGGKTVRLKGAVDDALVQCPEVEKVFTYKRTGGDINMKAGRDVWMHDLLPKASTECAPEPMNSEDPMFILYTSGSTGKPKGLLHTTGGYTVYAATTAKNTFDLRKNDVFCCVADCGWVTGHTYIVYGPLLNGVTSVLFESVPTYPDPYRYWELAEKVGATQFYTAPTAIRALMRYDTAPIKNYNLNKLRVIGSVGEPINPEAWKWYFDHVGQDRATVVDTYWQTETGGHIATNLPGAVPMKPSSCSSPFYGIQFAVLESTTGKEIQGNNVEGVLAIKAPWPAMARTVYGDHDRYLKTYLKVYDGYYITGDACRKDQDGAIFITGRVDDVINPSGHRIGTAELEAILNHSDEVSESAVIGFPHDVKGEGIGCYVVLKDGIEGTPKLTQALKKSVRDAIGPFATPDFIVYGDLPKTRSGKIMRRILRKIAVDDIAGLGDTSTLADPAVVPKLVEAFKIAKEHNQA